MKRTVSLLGLVVLCVGCSLFSPQPDRSKFFVLTSVPREARRTNDGMMLGIGPVQVPSYLGRPEIARRQDANQLVFSPNRLWGEPLELGFRRVLTEDLSKMLGTVQILQYPWSTGIRVEYQIPIVIGRFEADEHGTVSLEARWAIRCPGQTDLLLARESRIERTSRDPSTAAVVAAMSEAVGALSDDIAAGLEQVTAAPRPRR
jgi:uncharacterized protein